MGKKTTQKKTTTSRSGRSGRAKSTQEAGVAVQEPPSRGAVDQPGQPRQAEQVPVLTREQIARRAEEIWKQRGRPDGHDREHWLEAEEQLKREMGIR